MRPFNRIPRLPSYSNFHENSRRLFHDTRIAQNAVEHRHPYRQIRIHKKFKIKWVFYPQENVIMQVLTGRLDGSLFGRHAD